MPTTNSRELTLTTAGANVTINVKYNAVFSVFERRLTGLGLRFRERIVVIGVDPPGAFTGTVLTNFPSPLLAVTDGNVVQTIARNVSITVPRAALNEDQNPLFEDEDEIRCRVVIDAIGLPTAVTPDAFTDQEVLGGGIFQPIAATAN